MRSLSGLAAAYGFHLHAGRIFRCVLWIRFVPCRTSFGRFSHRTVYIQSTKPVAWLAMRPLRGLKFRLPAKNRLDQFRSCLKFLTILKRLKFQGPGSGFCLPIGGYFGSGLRFSRQIAGLSSFEKRRAIPRNPLPMAQTNKFKQLLKKLPYKHTTFL